MSKKKKDLSESLMASFSSMEKKTKNIQPKPERTEVIVKKRTIRSTISYQNTEHEIADKILSLLKEHGGKRGNFSDAVKIALRLCPLNKEEILKAWKETKNEDGRIIRHKV